MRRSGANGQRLFDDGQVLVVFTDKPISHIKVAGSNEVMFFVVAMPLSQLYCYYSLPPIGSLACSGKVPVICLLLLLFSFF